MTYKSSRTTSDCAFISKVDLQRISIRGFLQKLGVDFFSTFSPMATFTSIRMLLAIAVNQGLDIIHADIPRAFLKALLDTDIWLQLPPGTSFQGKNGKVLKVVKLIRSLYVLRDSPSNFKQGACSIHKINRFPSAGIGQMYLLSHRQKH